MDVISAKTLEVVLRVMHEFTLGEREHIGIGSVASDVVWEDWTSDILSRVEKKRRTWKTSTLTTGEVADTYLKGLLTKLTGRQARWRAMRHRHRVRTRRILQLSVSFGCFSYHGRYSSW